MHIRHAAHFYYVMYVLMTIMTRQTHYWWAEWASPIGVILRFVMYVVYCMYLCMYVYVNGLRQLCMHILIFRAFFWPSSLPCAVNQPHLTHAGVVTVDSNWIVFLCTVCFAHPIYVHKHIWALYDRLASVGQLKLKHHNVWSFDTECPSFTHQLFLTRSLSQ